jgi:hypothetical protein
MFQFKWIILGMHAAIMAKDYYYVAEKTVCMLNNVTSMAKWVKWGVIRGGSLVWGQGAPVDEGFVLLEQRQIGNKKLLTVYEIQEEFEEDSSQEYELADIGSEDENL